MKPEWNRKYNTIAFYACLVAAFTVVCIFAGINSDSIGGFFLRLAGIASPVIIGFVTAYLLNPLLKLFENRALVFMAKKKPRKKARRILSLIITYLIFALFLTLLFAMLIPQVAASYTDLASKMSSYVASAQNYVAGLVQNSQFLSEQYEKLLGYVDLTKIIDWINGLISDSYTLISDVMPRIFDTAAAIGKQLANIFFGVIFSVYFLLSKDKLAAQFKKLTYACLGGEKAEKVIAFARYSDKTFGGFIVGKLLDSLIIGLLTFIVMAIANMPYYPLIAVIIGVTNVIPFFGPIIGAIPSVFIIFIADPGKALLFLVLIVLIQQLDGNVIGPKILGDSTGLSGLWVIIAITLMSGLMGVTGMFIGVPTFAVIYFTLRGVVNKKLAAKSFKTETEEFIGSDLPRRDEPEPNQPENNDKDGGGAI